MNIKKTAVATAVGATLAISGVAQVAQADGHSVSVYGRINNVVGINSRDLAGGGDADNTNVRDIVSRIGVKASAPISASTTAFGHYEFSASTDSEAGGIGDTRVAVVGVRGDFGQVQIGNMWSTFYNIVGTHMDPSVTLGAVLYSTGIELPYRVSNAIQYSNSFGAVNVSTEIRISEEGGSDDTNAEKIGDSDGVALGVSFMATDNLLLAVAVDSSSDDPQIGAGEDVDRTGLAAKWTAGNWWASFSWGETEVDGDAGSQTQLHLGSSFGDGLSGFVGYGILDIDGVDDDPNALTLNLTKKMGNSGFRVYYEGVILSDSDDWYGYEEDRHYFGARIDF